MKKILSLLLIPLSLLMMTSCNVDDSSSSISGESESIESESIESEEDVLNEFDSIVFEDATFKYDGKPHSVYVSNVPSFASVSYVGNNKIEVGEYKVKAIITAPKYKTLTLEAKLTILEAPIIDVDDALKQFEFDNNLKYDDLFNNLLKNNFTLFVENGSEATYIDESVDYLASSYEEIAITDGLFYRHVDYLEENEYIYDFFEYGKIIGEDAIIINQAKEQFIYYKIPSISFYETLVMDYITSPFVYLKENNDGGFIESTLDLYERYYGEYSIKENIFELSYKNYIYHPEFTNSEVTKITYSNIGNTKINIDLNMFDNLDVNDINLREFSLNGVEYFFYDNEWASDIYISHFDLQYVEPSEYIIFPEIYNYPVAYIYLPYYVYNKDFNGYTFNVYFNDELIYQDEYSYIGEIKTSFGTSRYDPIEYFTDNNGKINYYGEW